jgi:effector-binding domain-containing protein
MPVVSLQTAASRRLAVVRRSVRLGAVASAWRPALDQVWVFLRSRPSLRTGCNVFLYYHPSHRDEPMNVDFGVEVLDPFEGDGEVFATETPSGEVAVALHVGPYSRLNETHDAVHAWASANQREFAGRSWEIYGHWQDDETKLETNVVYLLN